MKKFLSLFVAIALLLTLAACGGNTEETTSSADETAAAETSFSGKQVSIMTPYLSSVTTNQMVNDLEA